MDPALRDAISALVRARLAERAGDEDVEAMAAEAAMLAGDIDNVRQRLTPGDDPGPLHGRLFDLRKPPR